MLQCHTVHRNPRINCRGIEPRLPRSEAGKLTTRAMTVNALYFTVVSCDSACKGEVQENGC
jgi:hypothetical protein